MCFVEYQQCESESEKSLSCIQLFATRWTVAHQAPPSMEFIGTHK